MMRKRWVFTVLFVLAALVPATQADEPVWKKHVVWQGSRVNTAVGGDFTGDGLPDVVFNGGGATRLMIAPDWREVVIDDVKERNAIHAEVFDVDRDGDLDFIGARYQPGLVFWLETPADPKAGPWKARVVDEQINGIHGLLKGDVDRDGRSRFVGEQRAAGAVCRVGRVVAGAGRSALRRRRGRGMCSPITMRRA